MLNPSAPKPHIERVPFRQQDYVLSTPTLVFEILRPYILFSLYWWAAYAGIWWLAILFGIATILAGFVQMHDTMHHALGLSKRMNTFFLSLSGALILKSGHGNQITHLRHHGKCLDAEKDPEGAPALWSFREVLLRGPYHLLLLRREAMRMAPRTRSIQLRETAFNALTVLAFILIYIFWHRAEGLVYYGVAFFMSVTMPIWATYIPHHLASKSPVRLAALATVSTWTPIISSFAFHHLHHHYPRVPTALLPKAARQLPEVDEDEDHIH